MMTAMTHYIDVKVLPLDPENPSRSDEAFVLSKVVACIHLHIENSHVISIGFPGYSLPGHSLGKVVRVFGEVGELAAFLANPQFAQLIASAACAVGRSPIKEVPADTAWVVFKRDRMSEKVFSGYAERWKRRREKHGLSTDYKAKPVDLMPYVNMTSSSTGRKFPIFVKMEPVDGPMDVLANGYGLNKPVPLFE